MKVFFSFTWVAGFTALALFNIRDERLCRWFILVAACWGVGMALWARTDRSRRFLTTVAFIAGSYSLLVGGAWVLGVAPDWAYLKVTGPFLVAGMLAPAAGLNAGPIRTAKWKWIWLGLFLATGLVIEANNLRWIDYHQLHVGSIWAVRDKWTEKYYVYWLLLLVWICVSFFSWQRRVERLVILGLISLSAMLIWASGRSVRSLVILACSTGVYFLLRSVALSPRTLKFALGLLIVAWGVSPWLFNVVDMSWVDPRLQERTQFYRATHDLIVQRPWLGYGFGNVAQLTHPLLPLRTHFHYPGAHPHNLGLMFWLEYGLGGALFLCGVTSYLMWRLIGYASGRSTWPAIAALVVSFVPMVSFSWDVWIDSFILFYAVFASMVVLILNLEEDRIPLHPSAIIDERDNSERAR